MSKRGPSRFPPRRLPALTEAQLSWVRPVWFLLLALAIVLGVSGATFVLQDAYQNDPSFHRLSLISEVEMDGSVTVSPPYGEAAKGVDLPAGSRIVAIDGKPVARNLPVWTLAKQLARPDGATASLTIQTPEGRSINYRAVASDDYYRDSEGDYPMSRDVRIGLRLAIGLATCITLIGCGVLLFLRRPRDPVALLFSASFLIFAGVIDPPLPLWMASGLGNLFDAYTCLAWVFLVLGIAVFPDGTFVPRWTGWLLPILPVLATLLTIDTLPAVPMALIAFVAPLGLIMCQVIKFRRLEPGIERQQIKWAAYGFGIGLLFITASILIAANMSQVSRWVPIYGLIVLILFNAGFLLMALGLLISLTRFRLWEADQVISRSAISAAATLAVGVVWTLSIDLVKSAIPHAIGHDDDAIATAAGAVLAAVLFAPTQALAQKWAKRRLGGDGNRMRNLVGRLAAWRATETPQEIGQRTLSALAMAIHCRGAAILLDDAQGRSLVAARDIDRPRSLVARKYDPQSDPRFAQCLVLEDEDGPVGLLLVGPRSDDNRYNSEQLTGLNSIVEPLAESLRAARKRMVETTSMQQQIGSVVERLARLERDAKQSPV